MNVGSLDTNIVLINFIPSWELGDFLDCIVNFIDKTQCNLRALLEQKEAGVSIFLFRRGSKSEIHY